MVARQALIDEREAALEELEGIVAGLEAAGIDDVPLMVRRAGSAASRGTPVRPRYEDTAGTGNYYAYILLGLARELADQRERIQDLESKLAQTKTTTREGR